MSYRTVSPPPPGQFYIWSFFKQECMFPPASWIVNLLLYKKHWCTHQSYGPKKIPREHHCLNYFYSNGLFYRYQAGFLPGHSTFYQLLETYHNIVQSIDEGKSCCMIFCDLSKAFDRVWHNGLIFKLQTYGISCKLLQWFKSYLSHRSQKVMFKDLLSSKCDISAGVPQGSVLGPLLF